MGYDDRLTLACQGCTSSELELTPGQAQLVAENPYNYMWFCRSCVAEGVHIDKDFMEERE